MKDPICQNPALCIRILFSYGCIYSPVCFYPQTPTSSSVQIKTPLSDSGLSSNGASSGDEANNNIKMSPVVPTPTYPQMLPGLLQNPSQRPAAFATTNVNAGYQDHAPTSTVPPQMSASDFYQQQRHQAETYFYVQQAEHQQMMLQQQQQQQQQNQMMQINAAAAASSTPNFSPDSPFSPSNCSDDSSGE
jgi:hypothetical protein